MFDRNGINSISAPPLRNGASAQQRKVHIGWMMMHSIAISTKMASNRIHTNYPEQNSLCTTRTPVYNLISNNAKDVHRLALKFDIKKFIIS